MFFHRNGKHKRHARDDLEHYQSSKTSLATIYEVGTVGGAALAGRWPLPGTIATEEDGMMCAACLAVRRMGGEN